jgi:hypothetical protein
MPCASGRPTATGARAQSTNKKVLTMRHALARLS